MNPEGRLPAAKRKVRDKSWARSIRLMRLGREARGDGHTAWAKLLDSENETWADTLQNCTGQRILIATSMGINFGAARLDGLLAVALALRGAQVEHLYCDAVLPACMAANNSWYPDVEHFGKRGSKDDICKHCFGPVHDALSPLGQPIHRMGELVSDAEREEVARWAQRGNRWKRRSAFHVRSTS